MHPFTTLTSSVVPIPLKDIDTDMIIPANYLTTTTKEGLAEGLFKRLIDQNHDFPTNLEKFKNAKIIIADSNFGCGSSREHAVWAILGNGYRAIIAPSFSDIFFNNSAKNGLVLIQLPTEIVQQILKSAENGDFEITINLENQTATLPDGSIHNFPFDPFRKECILKGLEDIDYLLSKMDKINSFHEKRRKHIYFSTLKLN